MLGRAGQRFLLLGILAHGKEGKLCLEDHDGTVALDFSQLVCFRLLNDSGCFDLNQSLGST